MISFFLFSLFLCFINTLDIYVGPLNSNPPQCTNYFCTGKSSTPFDDLQYAINYGVNTANSKNDKNLRFLLIADPLLNTPFNMRPASWGSNAATGPFDNYNG